MFYSLVPRWTAIQKGCDADLSDAAGNMNNVGRRRAAAM